MTNDPTPTTPPPDESEETDEQAAEAFADEWMDYRQKVDHVTDFMNSILGLSDDEQPPTPTPPQPRRAPLQQKQAQRQPASPANPQPQPGRQPDTPPEIIHWYWRKRWNRGTK